MVIIASQLVFMMPRGSIVVSVVKNTLRAITEALGFRGMIQQDVTVKDVSITSRRGLRLTSSNMMGLAAVWLA